MKTVHAVCQRNRIPVLAGPLALVLLLSACGGVVPATTASNAKAASTATATSDSGSSAGATITAASSETASPTTGDINATDKDGTSRLPAAPARITPEEAKSRLDAGEAIVLVDVRTAEEHADIRIPGSLLLPVDEIGQKAAEVLPDKGATLFVYCRSGRRSAIAADELSKLGYTSIFDLGGIIDWPFDTESGSVGTP